MALQDSTSKASIRHQLHKKHLQRIINHLGNSPSQTKINVRLAASSLQSASLMASAIKNRLLRNYENVTPMYIRKLLDLTLDSNKLWSHRSDQTAKKIQYQQTLHHLQRNMDSCNYQIRFLESLDAPMEKKVEAIKSLQETLDQLKDHAHRCQLALQHMMPIVSGSLHPTAASNTHLTTMTADQISRLPSAKSVIRGFMIKLSGPRRNTKAETWTKSIGKISTNSVSYVLAEEAKLQIPSRLGIFGLTIRIVYSLLNRLHFPRQPIAVCNSSKPISFI